MDHLAPSSGVNWYNYNPYGEMLGGPQLPPVELGGLDVGRHLVPQMYTTTAAQVTLSNGMHYVQDGQDFSVSEAVPVPYQEPLSPLTEAKAANRVRATFGEKIACQECGATFACGANLRNHLRIHTGERPFVCEECGASFTQSSNLRTHKRVHTGERPYMCGICGQTFARSSHLPGHMRTHTGEKPFTCHLCGRSFATNQIMKNHLRTHTGERPFVCDVCEATFAQSSCLATHKKIHTGERNYKCGECGKAFISRSGLQTHERVHTGEKPFTCEKCDKSFKTSSYLSKHKQKYCCNNGYKNKADHANVKKAAKRCPDTQKEVGGTATQSKAATKFSKRLLSKRLRRSHRVKAGEANAEVADGGTACVDENSSLLSTEKESGVKTESVEVFDYNLSPASNGLESSSCRDCGLQENQDPLGKPCKKERFFSDSGCSNSLCNLKLADQCQMVTQTSYAVPSKPGVEAEGQVCDLQEEYKADENLQSASLVIDEKDQASYLEKNVLEGQWDSKNSF